MKRALPASFLMLALLVAVWGCDMSGLPTPTSIVPTTATTSAPSPTSASPSISATPAHLLPTLTTAPETTGTALDAFNTPTVEPTIFPIPPTLESAPTGTTMPVPSPTSGTPVDTPTSLRARHSVTPVTPSATRTRFPTGPTPTLGNPPPTAAPSETPPTDGWREVVRVAPGKHRIALTFDAGSTGETIPAILNTLRERHIHITMFITGKFAEQYPDGIRQMVADGHEIANHTYSHFDSKKITDGQLAEELAHTEQIIQTLTGVSTKPYWRPPYGSRNNHILNAAVSQGYRSIYWTLDSLDSVGQPKTPDFIFNRVTNTPSVNLDGAIVLQHFGSQSSAEALPREIDRLQQMGLQVVTISELLSP